MNDLPPPHADSSTAHITVLLREAVDALAIKADGVYVDATFGRGGHSRAILDQLGPYGKLIAIDRDPRAIEAGEILAKQDKRFSLHHAAMSELTGVLKQALGSEAGSKVGVVDGMLADLGVSSPQLDLAERGFSFRFDAPLDMRMDTSKGQTAAQWLADVDEGLLGEVIHDYGEERFATQIARALVAARQEQPVTTTRRLSEIVAQAVRTREPGKNPATRTFQALRIYINQELEELTRILPQCVDNLNPGGRIVVISFHSLEDRIVKHFLRDMAQGDKLPRNLPIRAAAIPKGRLRVVGRAVRASAQEVADNPRARSAVLRVAEHTG